jgi:Helix-turn-helix domain
MPSLDEVSTIENVLRLRRAERAADAPARDDIAVVREFLEGLLGLTVRPAHAARLLRISQPALQKWIEKGEIAAVITPEGRREIPVSELVELLEEVEQARESSSRPLASVIRERRRRSLESIDIDRLLPRRRWRGHRMAELQALAYHRVVADRLSEHLIENARRRLKRLRAESRIDPRWAEEWERILAMPLPKVAKAISADTPRARELRQTSPFAGVLTEQERKRLVRAVEERA